MARPDVTTQPLNRTELAQFLKSNRSIKAFEAAFNDVATVLPDAVSVVADAAAAAQATADGAQLAADAAQVTADGAVADAAAAQSGVDALEAVTYVVISASGTTSAERTLAVNTTRLSLTDGGANSPVTIGTTDIYAILAGDVTENAAAFTDATGLLGALLANAAYMVDALLTFQADATTTGIGLCFTLPAGAAISGGYHHNISATAIEGSYNIAAGAVQGDTSGVLNNAENVPIIGRWIIKTAGTAGDAQLQFRSEVAASTVTLKQDLSALTFRRLA